MAFGKQYKDDGSKIYVLKPTNRDENKNKVEPHFAVFEKVDGKWVQTRKENRVSGDLFKIEIKEFEYEKVKTKSVTVGLRDSQNKEAYLIDAKFNIPARNYLFNSLISLTDNFNDISVSLYEKAYNDKQYEAYGVRQGDQFVPWKYKNTDLPKPVETTFKGQVMRDYTPVDELFEKELIALAARLQNRKSGQTQQAAPAAVATATTAGTDAPF